MPYESIDNCWPENGDGAAPRAVAMQAASSLSPRAKSKMPYRMGLNRGKHRHLAFAWRRNGVREAGHESSCMRRRPRTVNGDLLFAIKS